MPLLIDRLPLQTSLRPLSVLVFFLFLTHICKASHAVSCPIIRLLGVDGKGGVNLNCKSKGWQVEPQVIWLDAAGNPLPAGPTETDRGSDGLYTVSSIVTVEKRLNNTFTCRVQRNSTNQTREGQIYIAENFFVVNSSSTIIGLAVGLAVVFAVCILVILILGSIVWKNKISRCCRDQTMEVENEIHSQSNRSEGRVVTGQETETQQLLTHERVQMEDLNEEDQQRREAAEKTLKTLKEALKTKKTELRKKQSDLRQFDEEKQKKEENVERLKEQLEKKNTEVKTLETELAQYWKISSSPKKKEVQQKKEEAEKDVETLKERLETEETELDTLTKEFDDKQARVVREVQKLQEEIQGIKTDIQNLTEKLESNNVKDDDITCSHPSQLESSGAASVQPSSSSVEGNQA